ncbi:MAG: hypothetical protein ACTSRG_12080 [Candidatus Helarchaeota archaeon]
MDEKKEKLIKIINNLEKTKKIDSKEWKQITTQRKKEFENIKKQYREKQNELRNLILEKKLDSIKKEEFDAKLNELQDELSELEKQIFNLRMGSK